MKKKKQKKIKRKLKYKAILSFLVFFCFLGLISFCIIKMPITNIYINGNEYLSDLDIMKIAGIDDYPPTIKTVSLLIEKKLNSNYMIISSKVKKKGLTKIYIEVEENRPLFYNSNIKKIVMRDKSTVDSEGVTPYLLNYIPDSIYEKFIDKMININPEVLARISEIEYKPIGKEKEGFRLSMTDGNYVYLTIQTFEELNEYINYIKHIDNKKGIICLDFDMTLKENKNLCNE